VDEKWPQARRVQLEEESEKALLGWAVLRIRTKGTQRVVGAYNGRPMVTGFKRTLLTSYEEYGILTDLDPPPVISVNRKDVDLKTITKDKSLRTGGPLLHFIIPDGKEIIYGLLGGQHRMAAAEEYLKNLDEALEKIRHNLRTEDDQDRIQSLRAKEEGLTRKIQFGSRWWVKVYDSGQQTSIYMVFSNTYS
jgi:hypothetical protein